MVVSKPGNCGGPSAAGKPVVVVLRQGGRRYPGNSGGPGNGGGIQAGKNGQAAGKSN